MRAIIVGAALLVCSASAFAQTFEQGASIRPSAKVRYAIISPTGAHVIFMGSDDKLHILSLPTGSEVRSFDRGPQAITAAAYSAEGSRLALAYANGTVRIVDASNGNTISSLAPSTFAASAMALSPNGRFVALAPTDMPTQVWDVGRKVMIAKLDAQFSGANALAFSPDGSLLASADGDAVVRLYDATTGKLRWKFDDLLLESFAVAFTPDFKTLVVGGGDRAVVAIDVVSGKELRRLITQKDPVAGIAVLADGHTVIASFFSAEGMSNGKNTVSWDLRDGRSKVLTSGKSFMSAAAVKDGRMLLATREGDGLRFWSVH